MEACLVVEEWRPAWWLWDDVCGPQDTTDFNGHVIQVQAESCDTAVSNLMTSAAPQGMTRVPVTPRCTRVLNLKLSTGMQSNRFYQKDLTI